MRNCYRLAVGSPTTDFHRSIKFIQGIYSSKGSYGTFVDGLMAAIVAEFSIVNNDFPGAPGNKLDPCGRSFSPSDSEDSGVLGICGHRVLITSLTMQDFGRCEDALGRREP